jgi:hypothetical protein
VMVIRRSAMVTVGPLGETRPASRDQLDILAMVSSTLVPGHRVRICMIVAESDCVCHAQEVRVALVSAASVRFLSDISASVAGSGTLASLGELSD